jgi:ubiquinone/menaquinone biosynthesis C-methylase UbiE
MNTNQQKVVKYYTNPETKLGFDYVLWGSKHFGFYPTGKADITEKEAQILHQDLVAKNLALKENQIVLDAGCGQGVVSTYLAKKYGSKIFGITLVPFEVERAQERAKNLGVQGKAQYQVMDYSATSFPDNYFDAIYTTETLSHSPDIRKTLKEFFRILKPSGKIALFEYTLAPDKKFSEWERKMLNVVIEGSAMVGLKDFRHDQFTEVVKKAGFENVKEQNITENIRPSFYRLHKLSRFPYKFIKLLGLQKFFINTTAGYEYYKMADKGLFRYCIFTGNKPKEFAAGVKIQ